MNIKKTIYISIIIAVFSLQITAINAATVIKYAENGWINNSEKGYQGTGLIRTSSISNLGLYARGTFTESGTAWFFIDMKLGGDSFYLTKEGMKYYQFKVSWTWNGYYQEGPGDSFFMIQYLVMEYDKGTTLEDYYDYVLMYDRDISAGSWSTSSVTHTWNFYLSSSGYYRIVILVETHQSSGFPISTRRTQFYDTGSGYYLDLNYISAIEKFVY